MSWTAEPDTSASIFTGGGSKDGQNINNWAWKNAGGLPDKDNLLHSFAARYSLPDDPVGGPTACPKGTFGTCELLVFGSDRFDNSGDAVQAFWFPKQDQARQRQAQRRHDVQRTAQERHLLVITEFSNGGDKSTIAVYAWDDTVLGNLRELAKPGAANCASRIWPPATNTAESSERIWRRPRRGFIRSQ